jgi:hypothetical protein
MAKDKKAAKDRYNQIKKQQLASSPKLQTIQGSKWPITKCLMAGNWDHPGNLMAAMILRTHPTSGQMAIGIFLIDLACMGVKSATGRFASHADLDSIERNFAQMPPIRSVAPETIAMLIQAALRYGYDNGIDPDPDWAHAKLMLERITPEPLAPNIHFGGEDGKPFFIAGPEDNVELILRKLTAKHGAEGFTYMVGGPV